MVTSFRYGRTRFGNSERGISFSCAIHPFSLSHSMPHILLLLVVPSAGNSCQTQTLTGHLSLQLSYRSRQCKSNPYYVSTVLGLTKNWDSMGFTISRQYFWKIVHQLQIDISPQQSSGYLMH